MKKILLITLMMLVTMLIQAQINKPVIPPPPRVGTISLTSNPLGCSIFIDGEFVGKSPIKLKRNPGTYTIVFELEGYESHTKSVKVTAGKTTKITAKFEKPIPTPKDSIILSANEIIGMSTNYENATLTTEEKVIVSFQKNAEDYAKGVKEMYEKIVDIESAAKMSTEELKVIITNCVLRNQHCNNLEKPCIQSALNMIQNMGKANSHVYQGVNTVELAKLAEIVQKQAIDDVSTAKIVELIGQVKLTEALDLYQQGLLNPEIIERYNSFLSVLKGFYVLSNMRMTEIKNDKDAQIHID